MPQLDFSTFPSQIFWLLVMFALLYALLAGHVVPRIGKVLETRGRKISGDLQRAETLRLEAEGARQYYEDALKASRDKAQSLIAESISMLEKSSAARRHEQEADIEARLAKAEKTVAASKARALEALAPAAQELAQYVVETLLPETVNAAEVAKAVEQHLQQAA